MNGPRPATPTSLSSSSSHSPLLCHSPYDSTPVVEVSGGTTTPSTTTSREYREHPGGERHEVHRIDRSYQTLPTIRTTCYVVFVKDCLNYDIDYDLTPEQALRYERCINQEYRHASMDPVTLEMGPPTTGKAYRSRLLGITAGGNKKQKRNEATKQGAIVRATLDVIDSVNMTSGFYNCELGDIDIFNRVLVTLYDPVTGQSLNRSILDNYGHTFTEYHSDGEDKRRRPSKPFSPKRGPRRQY